MMLSAPDGRLGAVRDDAVVPVDPGQRPLPT